MKERRFEDLSGGEKQRAWLAFCLAQDKDFLVLDESLDGLDFFAKRAFFELLAELAARDRGVLLATHEMELAGRFAARLLVLEDGRLCYDGLPRDDLLSLFSPDRRALAHA
jgi:iron complex transport system ATP-binding protein